MNNIASNIPSQKPAIIYFDSLENYLKNKVGDIVEALKTFVKYIYQNKFDSQISNIKYELIPSIQQNNIIDCGFFCLIFTSLFVDVIPDLKVNTIFQNNFVLDFVLIF
jgi:Ulp1 family protease